MSNIITLNGADFREEIVVPAYKSHSLPDGFGARLSPTGGLLEILELEEIVQRNIRDVIEYIRGKGTVIFENVILHAGIGAGLLIDTVVDESMLPQELWTDFKIFKKPDDAVVFGYDAAISLMKRHEKMLVVPRNFLALALTELARETIEETSYMQNDEASQYAFLSNADVLLNAKLHLLYRERTKFKKLLDHLRYETSSVTLMHDWNKIRNKRSVLCVCAGAALPDKDQGAWNPPVVVLRCFSEGEKDSSHLLAGRLHEMLDAAKA